MKYQSWMLHTSLLVCVSSTSMASQQEDFPAPAQQARTSWAPETQVGQETGNRLLARIMKIVKNISSTVKNETSDTNRDKLIHLGHELIRATERTENYVRNQTIEDFLASPEGFLHESDNMIMTDSRAFAIRAAPILGMEITSSGESFEKKLLYRVLKKLEDMTTPRATNPIAPRHTPAAAEPSRSRNEENRFQERIELVGKNMFNLMRTLKTAINSSHQTTENIVLFQYVISYVIEKQEAVMEKVRPAGYQGRIVPAILSLESRQLAGLMILENVLQYGTDLAKLLGIKVTADSKSDKLILTERVIAKLEEMAATAPQDQGHSPQYQEPGPQSQPETAPESPATSPFEYHEHHYQEHPSPQAEPNPITAGKKIILTEKEEKQYLEELKKTTLRMNHVLQILDPNFTCSTGSTDSETLKSLRQYIRNTIQMEHQQFSPPLTLRERIKKENIFACHFILSFGMDTAGLFGIEKLEDTIPYRLKLTNIIFNKIEKIVGVR